MKIILASFGSYGDIQPFLTIGRTLQILGHEIEFIANPFFTGVIQDEGFGFHPAGTLEDYHTAATPAVITGSRTQDQRERIAASRRLFTSMFMNPVKDTYDIISSNRTADTAVLGHFYAYGAKLASERHRLPFVNICLSPYWLKGFIAPSGFQSRMQRLSAAAFTSFVDGQLFTKPMNALRAEAGLGPMQSSSARWMFEGNTLCLFPGWLADFKPEKDLHVEYAGFPLQPEDNEPLQNAVEEFLQCHSKPIVFTPGSAATDTKAYFTAALEALGRLGRPGILLSRSQGGLPVKLPDHVIHADFAPLGLLLERCAAIVHHGGIGTAAQALASGTPQLLCPRIDEQKENARVLQRLGVSDTLQPDNMSGQSMANKLDLLIHSQTVAQACREAAKLPQLRIPQDFMAEYVRRLQ